MIIIQISTHYSSNFNYLFFHLIFWIYMSRLYGILNAIDLNKQSFVKQMFDMRYTLFEYVVEI